jgi:serine/threonine-protein kinase
MTLEERITVLLSHWEASRVQGRCLTPEELCHDCPDLLPEVRKRLQRHDSLSFLIATPVGTAPTGTPLTASTLPPEAARPLPVAAASSRYRRMRFHAKGGLGEVYLGLDTELRREVALKRIQKPFAGHPEARRRFLREAEVTGRLEHPGVVPVHGLVVDEDGVPCYAMRFIRGESLQAAIRHFHMVDKGKLDPGERSLALRQLLSRFVAVCNTVAYAHSRGILHRDLKPDNVMLGKYGETLVVDWGLARPITRPDQARASGEETLPPTLEKDAGGTLPGQTLGTPAYMSPEQAAGRWDVVGPASDVYSLGATMYALLTGHIPFSGKSHAEVLQKVQRGDFPLPRQVEPTTPAALQAICLKAMAQKPEDRYATALEMAGEVERWLADERVQAYREPLWVRLRRRLRRHKTLVAAVTALVLTTLVLGGAAGVWYQQHRAEMRRGVEASLEKLPGLLQQWRWKEADTILGEAESRLGRAGPADLRARVAQARADLNRAVRLDAIRQERLTWVEGKYFNRAATDQAYAAAFREAGLGQEGDPEEEVAARIRASAVRGMLVAGLDAWANVATEERQEWLLGVARRADPDAQWRDQFRHPQVWRDRAALERLAREAPVEELSAPLLAALGEALARVKAEPVPLLTAAQQRYPEDFELNMALGCSLLRLKEPGEAVSYYRAALALRPESAAAHTNLGIALRFKGRLDEALAELHRALALDPEYAPAHTNLGITWKDKGRLDEALAALHRALELDPESATAHHELGMTLRSQGRLDAAVAAFRRTSELVSQDVGARDNLRDAERLADLNRRLPALLEGREQPADDAERLALARLCQQPFKKLYTASARLYAEAFAHDAQLADDLPQQHRYQAACAAALAGCGQGADAGRLDDQGRARLRQQARDWLRDDLVLWAKQGDNDEAKARAAVQQTLRHWQADADLAGLRDPNALTKLPPTERDACRKLWDDVSAVCKAAGELR